MTLVSESFEIRVGVDVQSVSAVADSIDRFGTRYTERIYTAEEIRYCGGTEAAAAEGLAARFAAKEACMKLLRVGDEVPPWTSIEVRHQPGGWCELSLGGAARRLADRAGVRQLSLSMSHEAGIATATVVGVCTKESV